MNLRRILHTNKGYTLIELMITLFIFAIITMFGVPAFYNFIEQSRAKTQMVKAANFLRSAQEIATASNRTVYVYTTGYFKYGEAGNNDPDYWYQDWVMSFKPIGHDNKDIDQQDDSLEAKDPGTTVGNGTPNANYLISQQTIFTKSDAMAINVLDSDQHNAIDRRELAGSGIIEMEGYSRVREAPAQGVVDEKPTYLVFYPSGAVVMPIFYLSRESFDPTKAHVSAVTAANLQDTIGVLAGCRMAGGLNIDSINYTNDSTVITHANTFTHYPIAGTSGSAPSFSRSICGSRFLQ